MSVQSGAERMMIVTVVVNEMEQEDESGPAVSGAAVDAYTERLKGVLGDGGSGAAAAAYGLARAGNGSLKPIASPAPAQAPAASSAVPPATGNASSASAVPTAVPSAFALRVSEAQWAKLTPQQQQIFRQQHILRQQQQQQAQQQALQQQAQQRAQQQANAGSGGQAQRRAGGSISQGISFGALMPLLQPHLPSEQSERLSALYERFKASVVLVVGRVEIRNGMASVSRVWVGAVGHVVVVVVVVRSVSLQRVGTGA